MTHWLCEWFATTERLLGKGRGGCFCVTKEHMLFCRLNALCMSIMRQNQGLSLFSCPQVFNVRRVIDLLENVDTYTAVSTGQVCPDATVTVLWTALAGTLSQTPDHLVPSGIGCDGNGTDSSSGTYDCGPSSCHSSVLSCGPCWYEEVVSQMGKMASLIAVRRFTVPFREGALCAGK